MIRDSINYDAQYNVMQRVYKIRIAVCDDERHIRNYLVDALTAYSNERHLEIEIYEYQCGEDLIKTSRKFSIVFLDYIMEGIDGLETARILRKNNTDCQIIFLTNFPQFVYDSFEVNTFRFFVKPPDVDKLYLALDDYLKVFGNDFPLQLSIGRETVSIQTNSVIYIEADNKNCYIYLAGERLHCAMSMASIAKIIPKTLFYKVNKSFIINFSHISNYNSEFICFSNGNNVPVSRRYQASFKNAYQNFARGRVL